MSEITSPILLDSTGQDIVAALKAICASMGGGASGLRPQIIVTTDVGATVTCSLGKTSLSAVAEDGTCVFDLDSYGDWVLTETFGSVTVERTVRITDTQQHKETIHTTGYITLEKVEGVQYRVGFIDPETKVCMPPDKIKLLAELIKNNSSITLNYDYVFFHYGNEHYKISVGDYIYFTVDDDVEPLPRDFVLIGFNHPDYVKAGITFQMKTCLVTKYAMNDTDTNAGGWRDSKLRTEVMPTILAKMPTEWTSRMATVKKRCETNVYTEDKLFILSETEITGDGSLSGDSANHRPYRYYANAKLNGSSPLKGVSYWTRSVRSGVTDRFRCYMQDSVGEGMGSRLASEQLYIPLAFCM